MSASMRHRLIVAGFVAAVVACGGAIEGQNPNEQKECPSALVGTCTPNMQCTHTVPGCYGTTRQQTCQCSQEGQWLCPDDAIACPEQQPCNDAYEGLACNAEGRVCPGLQAPKCGNGPVQCTCTNGRFHCPQPKCGSCPPAIQVRSGMACSEAVYQCAGTNSCGYPASSCWCSGPNFVWHCTTDNQCVYDGGGASGPDE